MMFVPAFTVDVTLGLSSWLAVLLGAWIMMLAVIALGYPGAKRLRIASAVLGVALVLAPWLFGYANSGAAADNALAVGTLVSLVSISGQVQLWHTLAQFGAQGLRLTPKGTSCRPPPRLETFTTPSVHRNPLAEMAEELVDHAERVERAIGRRR